MYYKVVLSLLYMYSAQKHRSSLYEGTTAAHNQTHSYMYDTTVHVVYDMLYA
jgi:hypothetical protein